MPPIPSPRPTGPLPGICYYCHGVQIVQPTQHGNALTAILILIGVLANICIILAFIAAWIRRRNVVDKKIKALEVEIANGHNGPPPGIDLIVYVRVGRFALVKIPTHVYVEKKQV